MCVETSGLSQDLYNMFRGVNSETKEPMQKQVPSNFPTCKEGLRLLHATDMGVPDNLRRNRGAREIPGGLSYTLLHCTKHTEMLVNIRHS